MRGYNSCNASIQPFKTSSRSVVLRLPTMLLSYKENILPVEWYNNVVHYAVRSSKNHTASIRKTLHKRCVIIWKTYTVLYVWSAIEVTGSIICCEGNIFYNYMRVLPRKTTWPYSACVYTCTHTLCILIIGQWHVSFSSFAQELLLWTLALPIAT